MITVRYLTAETSARHATVTTMGITGTRAVRHTDRPADESHLLRQLTLCYKNTGADTAHFRSQYTRDEAQLRIFNCIEAGKHAADITDLQDWDYR